MLDAETKRRIDNARDILVGKIPDPKSQVEQITLALIYKFMDDMDKQAEEWGGEASFFTGKFSQYSWSSIFDPKLGGYKLLDLYSEALIKMNQNPNIPVLFREIFKNAYLPYRDPETLKSFLKEISGFCYDHSEKLGDAYEYLLSVLGSQGDAGQFRTPRHIIDFMVKVLDPKKNETILDPACGTAGFLISSFKHIMEQNTKETYGDQLTPEERNRLITNFNGYDISPDMVRISLVNMYLHGFADPEIHEYDTLTSEERWNDTADVILANPPFMTPKGGIRPHKRFSIQANRSEVLFVDYIAEHMNNNGRAGIIVPEGIIFQSGNAYKALRKMLVENYLYAVVSLPAGVFNPYSGVKTSILFMDKAIAKKTDSILFVKIENDGFDLGAQRREIKKNDLGEALELITSYQKLVNSNLVFSNADSKIFDLVLKRDINDGEYSLSLGKYRKLTMNYEFQTSKIKDIGEVVSGFGFPVDLQGKVGQEFPFYKVSDMNLPGNYIFMNAENNSVSQDIVKKERYKVFPPNTIIFPKIGAAIATNKKRILIKPSIFDNNVMGIIPNEHIDYKYLFYLLGGFDIINWASESSPPSIRKSTVEEFIIPLPPIEVQKEIVSEIEGYQKIIDGAKQVSDNYKPQIKIDPAWELVEAKEIFKLASGKFLTQKSFIPGEYKVYGGNGVSGTHNDYFLEDSTLIIGRVGEYCGAIHLTVPQSWVTDNALYVTEYFKEINQKYLAYILTQLNLNQYAKVGGQPSISQSTVYETKIPLPPLGIQNSIVEQLETERKLVESNKSLIEIFKKKIENKIAEVWGY